MRHLTEGEAGGGGVREEGGGGGQVRGGWVVSCADASEAITAAAASDVLHGRCLFIVSPAATVTASGFSIKMI